MQLNEELHTCSIETCVGMAGIVGTNPIDVEKLRELQGVKPDREGTGKCG